MGRKGGFSCPGGEQKLLMELFRENPESVNGDFHPRVEGRSLPMDLFCKNHPSASRDVHVRVRKSIFLINVVQKKAGFFLAK
ncbi:hypothetical protein CV945_16685 [Geobacillus sp. Manikaran-105]|nr:hypothetical protein CV945_16685 [Geobacillus sp. Manikaran-105]